MTPIAYTVVVLFVVAVLGLLAAGAFAFHGRLSERNGSLSGRTIFARALSYAVLATLLGGAVLLGAPGIALLILILSSVALWEWQRLTDLPWHHRVAMLIANVVVVGAVYLLGAESSPWLIGGIVLAGLTWPVVRVDTGRAVRDLGFAAVGFMSIAVMLAHAVALAHDRGEAGVVLVAALALACAGSDVGAFLVGRRFGRAPLAPTLSPAKTRAGVLGNVFGAVIGFLPLAPALTATFGIDGAPVGVAYAALFVAVVAIGSVWGDLFESAVKREAGVKDAGAWLPGFGGILDRIDSLLLTLPLAYWSLRLLDIAGLGPGAQ